MLNSTPRHIGTTNIKVTMAFLKADVQQYLVKNTYDLNLQKNNP